MWHKENTLLIASRHAHALKSLQALQTPHLARRGDDDDCCLFSHEKTLGLFERKKTDVEAKKERDNYNQNAISPSLNEILVEYKHRAQAHGRLFRTIKVDKSH